MVLAVKTPNAGWAAFDQGRSCRPGTVVLVGAGPGDPELLTVRAVRRIREADVVVYDRLIHPGALALAKASAEKIYMGKPQGHHAQQSEIHALLVVKAREGKVVVRLKGGDPFLFGRGGEEVEYLAEHGIPFEVVPGVSSCLSAPLSAGIAVTHRDASSSVAIVTGHSSDGHEDRVDWEAVARIGTLVFLMGVHNIETIARKLIAAGRAADTPAAMIQMAFCEGERVVTGTLENIAIEVRRAEIESPATLVVGEVVRLRDRLQELIAVHLKQEEVVI
jgi:uroporphyrinogen III methyltransferase / synthase